MSEYIIEGRYLQHAHMRLRSGVLQSQWLTRTPRDFQAYEETGCAYLPVDISVPSHNLATSKNESAAL